MARLLINGSPVDVDVEDDTPLLWVLRDHLGMTGTKFGCGIAQCGACTVLLDGAAMRSCVLPVSAAAGKDVQTIEGENRASWAIFEAGTPAPGDDEIDAGMRGNLCRCGTYPRIRQAIKQAAAAMTQENQSS